MNLTRFAEPPLQFGNSLSYDVYDPVYGLHELGPFDWTRRRAFNSLSVVAIGPQSAQDALTNFWQKVTEGVEPLQYEPSFEGLKKMYRLEDVTAITNSNFVAVDRFQGSTTEDRYVAAIDYSIEYHDFDLLLIVEAEESVYYLHDFLKRTLIAKDVPSQYVELDTLSKARQGSVLNNFAVASYAKVGGIPWQLKCPVITNSCVVGFSFHLLKATSPSQRQRTIIGIAEIIDEFGTHLSMTVSKAEVATEKIKRFRKQFRQEFNALYVPSDLMEQLIKDVLSKFSNRPDRTLPQRLIIHKTTAFHEEEMSGLQAALEELKADVEYALVHIKEETIHRVYREKDKEVIRGMLLTLRDDFPEAVLWTVGKVPFRYWEDGAWKYYEKSGAKIGTSDPIVVHLDKASKCLGFDFRRAAFQVLGLTKMRWNTVELSLRLPASIYFAQRAGKFVANAMRHGADLAFVGKVDARHFL
jgi:hypothetical protein